MNTTPDTARAIAAKTILLAAGSLLLLPGCASVEQTYTHAGPYATTKSTVTTGKKKYVLYYPKDYTALHFKSPIVTWGNGTNAKPEMYSTLLAHLASYGFTVVAADLKNTGSGNDIGAAAQYMVHQNSVSGPFNNNLDAGHVAAVGHSQGAGGAVNAALKNRSLIKTVVTFSLPNKNWASANPDCPTAQDCRPDVSKLTQPVFFSSTRGLQDLAIASPKTEKAYFDSIRGPAVMGIITLSDGRAADHSSIQDTIYGGNPGGELAYPTAWLEYQLMGKVALRRAFTGAKAEIVTNPNWHGSAVK